ncbi:kinase-like protein, partial [Aureobasidium melanogenum]
MNSRRPASNLTLEQFLISRPQFHWSKQDGTRGPAVGNDYEPVPVQLGSNLDDLLAFSDKSHVLLVQLVTEDGKQDRVAAKIMRSSHNVEKLKNELNILKSLRHKHIAAVLGSFSHARKHEPEPDYGILVFPLAAQDLQRLLEEISKHNKHQIQSNMSWSPHQKTHKLLPYFACLCKTVLFLHKQDRPIKHRDIKPENILIDKIDNVILADFDISKAYDNVKEAITYGSLDGTIMYSSKDVWKESAMDDPEGSSKRGLEWDVVSLGFVFLEMATVLFGKTLDEMRKPMKRRSAEGFTSVVYSEALAEIKTWLNVLHETATSTPHMVPDQFFQLSHAEPNYVRKFLEAIEGMMSAEQNNDRPLKRAWMTFGCLTEHCPSPQSDSEQDNVVRLEALSL